MKTKILILLALNVIFMGCVSVANFRTDDQVQAYPASSFESIEVYSTDYVGKDFIVIGKVVASVDSGNNASKSVNALKKEAAKLGADAIINLKLEADYGYFSSAIKSTGTAVKFTNK